MPMYRTFRLVTRTVEVPPFCEGDAPIRTTYAYREPSRLVDAPDRAAAVEAARAIHGQASAGVERIGVRCQFCEDRGTVGNARTLTNADAPGTAACPRC